MRKFKKRDLIKNIGINDLIEDKFNGEKMTVTFVNQTFVDAILTPVTPSRDQFDDRTRQLDNSSIIKL